MHRVQLLLESLIGHQGHGMKVLQLRLLGALHLAMNDLGLAVQQVRHGKHHLRLKCLLLRP
jgi:hypothetical protein